MKLLTDEIKRQLPALYSQEDSSNPIVYVKFFSPYSDWTWYVTEGEEREDGDYLFFGKVHGIEKEWGYFTLYELESAETKGIKLVERDLYFKPSKYSDIEG